MKVIPLVLAVALLIGGPVAPDATGCAVCSCLPKRPPTVARDSADAVFAGRVIALLDRPVPPPDTTLRGIAARDAGLAYLEKAADRLRATIEVERVWKGEIGQHTEVYTSNECCICAFAFEVGKEYLIYAYRGPTGQLRTSICTRTRSRAEAAEDFAQLGPGAIPAPAAADSSRPPHN